MDFGGFGGGVGISENRQVVDQAKFDTMLELLKEYVAEYRDLPLQRTTYKGKVIAAAIRAAAILLEHEAAPELHGSNLCPQNLGVWVMHRKQNYWKGRLSQSDIKRLEEVPGWEWEHSYDFDHMMKLLREYQETNHRLPEYQSVTYR